MIDSSSHTAVLCHNDLLRANRIVNQGMLRAIDWEYCAMGNRWFDLAVVCVGDSLSKAQIEELLSSYLSMEPNPDEQRALEQHIIVYRYLELLWFCALDDPQERKKQLTNARFSLLDKSLEH